MARRFNIDPWEFTEDYRKAIDPKEYAAWDIDVEYKKLLEEKRAHPERFTPSPKLVKQFGKNGTWALYDVKVASKADENAILGLLGEGYSFVQDLGTDRAVYRKKLE